METSRPFDVIVAATTFAVRGIFKIIYTSIEWD